MFNGELFFPRMEKVRSHVKKGLFEKMLLELDHRLALLLFSFFFFGYVYGSVFVSETGSCNDSQAEPEHLASSDLPVPVSQIAGAFLCAQQFVLNLCLSLTL